MGTIKCERDHEEVEGCLMCAYIGEMISRDRLSDKLTQSQALAELYREAIEKTKHMAFGNNQIYKTLEEALRKGDSMGGGGDE